MTVIVWDGKTLAADREAGTTYIKRTRTTKIQRLADGSLLGHAGDAAVARELVAWAVAGFQPAAFPDECRPGKAKSARLLHISPEGQIFVYEDSPYPIHFHGPQHAIGAGTDAALAVMVCGFDARRAVEVASIVCNGCGGGIDCLALDELYAPGAVIPRPAHG